MYKIAKSPIDKLWYAIGSIKRNSKTYWIPISDGYRTKKEASLYAKKQSKVDLVAKKELYIK
jgi:hypothetical protein